LYALIGVNFPVQFLPGFLQNIAYALPMTRGIMAARLALTGADWAVVAPHLLGEVIVGLAYLAIGYSLFSVVERASMKNGMLDSI
jgi:ABC-2 type transport system permease protein